jgi:hypothetical protein
MGPWAFAAVIALVAVSTDSGKTYLKKIVKSGIRTGYKAKGAASELVAKASEFKDELAAEIREEKHNDDSAMSGEGKKKTKASRDSSKAT